MQNGHDDFCSRLALFFVDINRDSSAIIGNTYRFIGMYDDVDGTAVSC